MPVLECWPRLGSVHQGWRFAGEDETLEGDQVITVRPVLEQAIPLRHELRPRSTKRLEKRAELLPSSTWISDEGPMQPLPALRVKVRGVVLDHLAQNTRTRP